MKKARFTGFKLVIALVAIIALSACKKEKGYRDNDTRLHGTWAEASIHASLIHRLTFTDKGNFSMYIRTSNESAMLYSGSYVQQNENISVSITKQETVDNYGNKTVINTLAAVKLYENCTYKLNKDNLILKYTTYPTDAPVNTQAEFIRINAE